MYPTVQTEPFESLEEYGNFASDIADLVDILSFVSFRQRNTLLMYIVFLGLR